MTFTSVRGSEMKLPVKPAYGRALERVGKHVHDVEHYRVWPTLTFPQVGNVQVDGPPVHVAYVIDNNGLAYEGYSYAAPGLDHYHRKRGHEIAVGRAFDDMLNGEFMPSSIVSPFNGRHELLCGVELRDYMRPFAEHLAPEVIIAVLLRAVNRGRMSEEECVEWMKRYGVGT